MMLLKLSLRPVASVVVVLLFLGLRAVAANAQPVEKTEGSAVTVVGELRLKTAYGRPSYGEHPESDEIETYFAIEGISPPLLIRNHGKVSAPISSVQLVFMDNSAAHKRAEDLWGASKVKVSGVLWTATTGHHHEAALIIVKDVSW